MNEKIVSRRAVLKGALTVGCGLWMPLVLSGCSDKSAEKSAASLPGSTPSPAPGGSSSAPTPATTAKVSQASVQYQIQPKGDQKCSLCINFIAESNTCKLVEGQVSPEGWCILWAKKV